MTKPAPPVYFPPRCGVPEDVVQKADTGLLKEFSSVEQVLRDIS